MPSCVLSLQHRRRLCRFAINEHLAGGGLVKAGQHMQQLCSYRSRKVPMQRNKLTIRDLQVELPQRSKRLSSAPTGAAQVTNAQQRCAG